MAAGCGERVEPEPSSSSTLSSASSKPEDTVKPPVFANPLPIPAAASTVGVLKTENLAKVKEKYEINDETIGWLQVPTTTIDEQVMFHPVERTAPSTEKFFYERRDINKVRNTGPLETQFGSYFTDYRSTYDGGRGGLSRNTVIYGHSMSDNPEGGGFSPLKKYLDPEFAKATPYVYYSLADEDIAWEVFAVFYTTVNLLYNVPDPTDEEFTALMEECRARSIYNYDVEVTEKDKILTLSTCCYNIDAFYPNKYRYVIMAKMVEPGHMTAKEATFTKNENVKAP
jgi:sortase B